MTSAGFECRVIGGSNHFSSGLVRCDGVSRAAEIADVSESRRSPRVAKSEKSFVEAVLHLGEGQLVGVVEEGVLDISRHLHATLPCMHTLHSLPAHALQDFDPLSFGLNIGDIIQLPKPTDFIEKPDKITAEVEFVMLPYAQRLTLRA
jgi:hypothetical protein